MKYKFILFSPWLLKSPVEKTSGSLIESLLNRKPESSGFCGSGGALSAPP